MPDQTQRTTLDDFLELAIESGLFSARFFSAEQKLRFHLERLFGEIDFAGLRMLDIGGGSGLFSFYAALRGAKQVICLEPGAAGSDFSLIEKHDAFKNKLRIDRVTLEGAQFQDFDHQGEGFDIILSHNSINHLDEQACISLRVNQDSRRRYAAIAGKLKALANPGARLLICDCSHHNLFAHLGINNPFAPNIEWHKHQSPYVWRDLLSEAGFKNPEVEWLSFGEFRTPGQLLLGNKFMSYLLNSHFCLRMEG